MEFKKPSAPRLEEAACECYGIMQAQVKEWQSEAD